MFGRMVERLVEPGAPFFVDIGRGFDGDVVMIDLRLSQNYHSF
jgi:hypothetical protein